MFSLATWSMVLVSPYMVYTTVGYCECAFKRIFLGPESACGASLMRRPTLQPKDVSSVIAGFMPPFLGLHCDTTRSPLIPAACHSRHIWSFPCYHTLHATISLFTADVPMLLVYCHDYTPSVGSTYWTDPLAWNSPGRIHIVPYRMYSIIVWT